MSSKISVQNLSVSYNRQTILKEINLEIEDGENLCILGSSGSGKSVLVKAIVGIIKRQSGVVKINNSCLLFNVAKNVKDHNIAITFQNDGLFDSMNVRENLAFALDRRKYTKGVKARQLTEQAIEDIGLTKNELYKYPCQLSGGMRKRILIARAIIISPKIVFFDEPTTGLDPVTSCKITEMIKKYTTKKSVTSITITHSLACADAISDKIAMVKSGRIIWHGQKQEIKNCSTPYVKDFLNYAAIKT